MVTDLLADGGGGNSGRKDEDEVIGRWMVFVKSFKHANANILFNKALEGISCSEVS